MCTPKGSNAAPQGVRVLKRVPRGGVQLAKQKTYVNENFAGDSAQYAMFSSLQVRASTVLELAGPYEHVIFCASERTVSDCPSSGTENAFGRRTSRLYSPS